MQNWLNIYLDNSTSKSLDNRKPKIAQTSIAKFVAFMYDPSTFSESNVANILHT